MELHHNISKAARRVQDKLSQVKVKDLPITPYMRAYVESYISTEKSMTANLGRTADILKTLLSCRKGDLEDQVLVDYGGGQGMLSLLARESGLSQVYYNDINPDSVKDARTLARHLGLEATDYIEGEIPAIGRALAGRGRVATLLASSNVIEHIYDLEAHVRDLASLAPAPFAAVLATDANPFNPRVRAKRMATHRYYEEVDRPPDETLSRRDSHLSYRTLRRRQLTEWAEIEGVEGDIEPLVTATRGLADADLRLAFDRWRTDGRLPVPEHPTNTCHPVSGNWCERLIDFQALADSLKQAGFDTRRAPGGYAPRRGAAGLAVRAINSAIRFLGPSGVVLSPVVMVLALKSPTAEEAVYSSR